jgi:K+/H+ antiporter YhaU regulatory subunit KhtT
MREYPCMVISVLHDGKFITNPGPDYVFQEGDSVWVAGEISSCEWIDNNA